VRESGRYVTELLKSTEREEQERKRPHSGRVVVRALQSVNIVFVVVVAAAIARITPPPGILHLRGDPSQGPPSGHHPTLSRYLAPIYPFLSPCRASPFRLGFLSRAVHGRGDPDRPCVLSMKYVNGDNVR